MVLVQCQLAIRSEPVCHCGIFDSDARDFLLFRRGTFPPAHMYILTLSPQSAWIEVYTVRNLGLLRAGDDVQLRKYAVEGRTRTAHDGQRDPLRLAAQVFELHGVLVLFVVWGRSRRGVGVSLR